MIHKHATHSHKGKDRSYWDKFWKDRNGRIVIVQIPNIWLIAWLIFELISILVASHSLASVSWWLATTVLVIWALLETFKGVNYFRRLLGTTIAVMTILSVFGI